MTSIPSESFYDCNRLTKIINLNPTPQSLEDEAFNGVPANAVVYIPNGSSKAYKEAEGWNKFSDFREIGTFEISISTSTSELEEEESVELAEGESMLEKVLEDFLHLVLQQYHGVKR